MLSFLLEHLKGSGKQYSCVIQKWIVKFPNLTDGIALYYTPLSLYLIGLDARRPNGT